MFVFWYVKYFSPTQDMFYILQALSSMNDSPLNILQQT